MKNTKKIKKSYEFKNIFKNGTFYGSKNLCLFIFKTDNNFNKFGIAISKKYGKAVKRNYIKRIIRESFKINENKINNNYNIVIMVKKEANPNEINFHVINDEILKLLKKAGCIDEEVFY